MTLQSLERQQKYKAFEQIGYYRHLLSLLSIC